MGLQRATKDGPYKLDALVPGSVDRPWGLEVKDHIWIPSQGLGIGLDELQRGLYPKVTIRPVIRS